MAAIEKKLTGNGNREKSRAIPAHGCSDDRRE